MATGSSKKLVVTSSAFEDGGTMPSTHTCHGDNVSPDISWQGVPEGTASLVLIMEDRDVPHPRLPLFPWVHWVVYNIRPHVDSLPEAVPRLERMENGAQQGRTSFGRAGYRGPCPPFGTHRYYFQVYALDRVIDLEPRAATKKALQQAMDGHVLAEGVLIGRYGRQRG